MKTILFFAPGLGMGGIATVFTSLAAELEKNGWVVKVLLPYRDDQANIAVPKRYVVGYARRKRIRNRKLQRLINLFNALTGYSFYFVGVPRIKHDVFVVFQAASFSCWVKYSKKPVIGWFHGIAPAHDPRLAGKICTKLFGGFYNRFTKLIAITNQVADSWQRRYAIEKRPKVIPNLMDIEAIIAKSQMEQNEIRSDGNRNLVFVGRLAPEKGVLRLVRIAILLHGEGKRFVLWLVGEGELREKLSNEISAAHAEKYIRMIGKRDNPYPYMRACDLLVLPSYEEGLGLVLWEALLCGTNVLATECGGPTDALERGRLGQLVDNSDEGIYDGLKGWLDGKTHLPCGDGSGVIRQNDVRHRKEINEIFNHYSGL